MTDRPQSFILRDATDKARFMGKLNQAPLADAKGRPLIVFVRRLRKRRSLAQNRMLHMVWEYFGELANWGEGEAKEYFKDEYGPVSEMTLGGVRKTVAKPSSQYTPKEAQDMIDTVYRIASEAGFVLPEPHDSESWKRYAEMLEAK